MQQLRISTIIMLVLAIITTSTCQLKAQDSDFDNDSDQLVIPTNDSSSYPDYTSSAPFTGLENYYGTVDTQGANEITSMFSDDAWDYFRSSVDEILDFQPVADSTVTSVLTKVDNFILAGGLACSSQGPVLMSDPQLSSLGNQIGFTSNKTDKVKVLGVNSNAESWIFVVDEDALCFYIVDEDGLGISNALVTISYNDGTSQITKSSITTDGNVPGIAVFDDIPSSFCGILDIQAEGYHAISILDKDMEAGSQTTFVLTTAKENELYIRGVDLSGKDMVNEETKIFLMPEGSEELSLHILLSRTGDLSFPDYVEIYSDTREKTILKINKTSGYSLDSNTIVYTATKMWVDQNAGLLADGDIISVKYDSNSQTLEHCVIMDAVISPGADDRELPITNDGADVPLSDAMGGSGWLNFTLTIFKVPVTVGFFPDGSGVIMASYDLTNLADEETKAKMKFSSLFEKSWNPKAYSKTDGLFQVFKKSFWENANKVQKGQSILNSPTKVKFATNRNYSYSMNFSVFLTYSYNDTDKNWDGTGGLCFITSFSGGITEYFLIPVGTFIIPAYVGFEGGVELKTCLNINFDWTESQTEKHYFHYWDSYPDMSNRLDLVFSFSIFGGVGVRGALGVDATGYGIADFAAILKSQLYDENGNKMMPHFLLDGFFGITFNYYLLFLSGQWKNDTLQTGPIRFLDSEGQENDGNSENNLLGNELVFYDLDLQQCSDDLIPINLQSSSDTGLLSEYIIDKGLSENLESGQTTKVDFDTYPDNQIQFVATKNKTALFRIISEGSKTSLIYQLMDNTTGNIGDKVYKVNMPVNKSVTEFVVVANKTDRDNSSYCDNVYIGAVLADNTISDYTERSKTTEVVALTVNIGENSQRQCEVVSDANENGLYFYTGVKPVGKQNSCIVAYSRTPITSNLQGLLGDMETKSENIVATNQHYSGGGRVYKQLGEGTIYSTGTIENYQCSYWCVNSEKSTADTLYVDGYASTGHHDDYDPRCYFTLDISNMEYDDYNSIISEWQYMNNRSYFIAGGNIYVLEKENVDGRNYSLAAKEVGNGHNLINAEGTYQMITNNDLSAIYLIGIIKNYDVDMETSTVRKADNTVSIYTIITNYWPYSDTYNTTLHGPVTLQFADKQEIEYFTAAYNPADCQSKGISIVYNTIDQDNVNLLTSNMKLSQSATIRQWKQNAERGMKVTEVCIPNPLVTSNQDYIEAIVTYKNYGYAKEGPVRFIITDENGVRLTELNKFDNFNEMGEDQGHWNADLYTGDSDIIHVYFKRNPDWDNNAAHQINIEVAYPCYEGDIDNNSVASAVIKSDNISLSGKNVLIGDDHYVTLSIQNNTIIGKETPRVKVILDKEENANSQNLLYSMPTDYLYSFDNNDEVICQQIYNYNVNMDNQWDDENVKGAYFFLVDKDGNVVSNEIIYLENPHAKHEKSNVPDTGINSVKIITTASIAITAAIIYLQIKSKKKKALQS